MFRARVGLYKTIRFELEYESMCYFHLIVYVNSCCIAVNQNKMQNTTKYTFLSVSISSDFSYIVLKSFTFKT